MTVDTAICLRLLSIGAVTALVSQRVYVQVFPQHVTFPAVKVQRVSQIEPMHLRGPVAMYRSRVQVDSVGMTLSAAYGVDAAVQGDGLGDVASGLKGWTGSIGGSPGFVIHAIEPAGVQQDYNADELKQYRVMRDFMVHFTED